MKKILKLTMLSAVFLMLAGVFFLIACKEDVKEELQISIQNRTDDVIHVTLFPNEKYLIFPGVFIPSDAGGTGGGRDTEFILDPNDLDGIDWNELIFRSLDLNIRPHMLAIKAFDSIFISTANMVIKFTHENVAGYSENIFSENSIWQFVVRKLDMSTSIARTVKAHQYIFLISEDKIIIE
ncbi:MAG: hypothetical protein FWG79_04585 [Bacteroidales bacterium]|nr:hypothetical protein [Bacteroidales bacterium]